MRLGGATFYGSIQHDAVTTGANIYNSQDTGGHLWQNSGSTVLTLSNGGNLGLGVTPSAWGSGKAIELGQVTGNALWGLGINSLYLTSNARWNGSDYVYTNNGAANLYGAGTGNGTFTWFTAPSGTAGNTISFTQAMTLTATGVLLNNCTAFPSTSVAGISLNGASSGSASSSGASTSAYNHWIFLNGNGTVGSISTSGSTTTYSTSSDYRLKNTIAPITGALAKVALLKPCTYKWNADGSDGQGFIAHELAEVVPDCVTGEKDAVDAEGKPQYQGVDASFLVATLTAAIQELKAEFDVYKASHP
jgi:hypothetical protein